MHGDARGSGGMPTRKILKNRCPDIEFGDTLDFDGYIMCIDFKIQVKILISI